MQEGQNEGLKMKYLLCVFLGMASLGCNASVESLCEDVAVLQCQKCDDCGEDADQAASFCGISCLDGKCEDCVEVLVSKCNDKSAVLPEPKEALDTCEVDLAGLECSTLILAEVQGHDRTVSACVPFF